MGYLIAFLVLVVIGVIIWGLYRIVISKKVQKIAGDITTVTKAVDTTTTSTPTKPAAPTTPPAKPAAK